MRASPTADLSAIPLSLGSRHFLLSRGAPPSLADASHALRWRARVLAWPQALPDFDQFETCLPVLQQSIHQCRRRRGLLEPIGRFALRNLEQPAIAHEIDQPERWHAGLACAEEIARPAQIEIPFRDFETVGRFGHRFQTLARLIRERRLIEQEAVRLMPIAPDTAPELMQL